MLPLLESLSGAVGKVVYNEKGDDRFLQKLHPATITRVFETEKKTTYVVCFSAVRVCETFWDRSSRFSS